MASDRPDLTLLDGAVASQVLSAMRTASAQLERLGIRHLLVGGLAVGAWGHPRGTRDVDFLVGDEAYEHHAGGIVTMKPGVPIQVGGVAVDFLSPSANEPHLLPAFIDGDLDDGVPVAPLEVLAYLKLKSPRQRDLADLVELVKMGIDADRVGLYLQEHAQGLVAKWDSALLMARAEDSF